MAGDATFGALLRSHRRRAGLSQEELAARAFVSSRAISDLERGINARPRRHTAVALADGLGLVDEERAAFERHARVDDGSEDQSPAAAPRARPPHALDSFVDDGSSLADLLALLDDPRHRLITVIGPGGAGKTRLSLEMAHHIDPVAFVPLAALSDATLVAATIGEALGVEHGPTRTHLQSLIDHLGPRSLTLVLDNLEQIPDAANDIATLLRSCPGLRIVATSRVPLRVAGEVRFEARSLDRAEDAPAERPSVRLFLDRAASAGFGPGGTADDGDLAAVAELCGLLGGLPLAIELAAARSRVVAPRDMLAHLDQILDLLSSARADAPAQHRSMRAALEWSYELLPSEAQDAFAALGVFVASAPTDAVMAVWGLAERAAPTFYDLVQTLAEAHLVTVEPDPSGVGVRIDMFEPTRQFARRTLERSSAADVAHRRLTEWAVDLVGRAEHALFGPEQGAWLDRLDRDLPNLRAVRRRLTRRGTDGAVDANLRLVGCLQRFWDIRSRWSEGVAWLSDALASPGGAVTSRAKAHKALGVMNRCLGNLDQAEAEMRQAVALFDAAGDELNVASCLNNLGVIALDRSEFETSSTSLRRALATCEAHGDERLVSIVLNNLCLAVTELGPLREAFRVGRRCRRLLVEQGNGYSICWIDDNLAAVLTLAGHPHWAVRLHEGALRRRLHLGDEGGLIWSLEALSLAWTAVGETDRAGRALGFVAAHRRRLGTVPVPFHLELTARRSAALVARVGEERFAELWDEGFGLDPAEVWGWFAG